MPAAVLPDTLHIWTVSGDEIVTSADLAGDVRSLKQQLHKRFNVSRFRQRLVHEGRSLDDDSFAKDLPTDLQLVFLPYASVSEEQEEELILAASVGHVASVEASDRGHTEVVHILLEAGADNDGHALGGGYQGPALVLAAAREHLEIVRLLLEAGASTEAIGYFYGSEVTPLLATIDGHDHVARHESAQGPNEKSTEVARLLLEARADPNSHRPESILCLEHDARPLVAACQGGHLKTVRLLLLGSVDGEKMPDRKISPSAAMHVSPALVAAVSNGHMEVARMLVATAPQSLPGGRHKMPRDSIRLHVLTPLLLASMWGHVGIAGLLLGARADADKICGPDDATALSVAAGEGHEEIVRLLLEVDKRPTFTLGLCCKCSRSNQDA
ncbi:ANKHD1 [Symbiodinium sp. KB8]|nr:ANKHD1 [Symbiodinium sp. KB8]